MDAYLICKDTKKLIWLGKPIRSESEPDRVIFYSQNATLDNHDNPLLNRVLWRFLAEHAHRELRVVFSGEYDDDEYEHIRTSDIEAEDYVRDWPPLTDGLAERVRMNLPGGKVGRVGHPSESVSEGSALGSEQPELPK